MEVISKCQSVTEKFGKRCGPQTPGLEATTNSALALFELLTVIYLNKNY